MSKASSGMKLIKWLANQADDVAASADDLKRFGPRATRVRSLLDFLPKMSDDAARVSNDAYRATHNAMDPAYNAAYDAARNAARSAAFNAAKNDARNAAFNAGSVEAVSNLIDQNTYRILTNQLATGREADIVNMTAPENFMGILRDLTERNLVVNPGDVRSVRKLAGLSDYERGQAMEFFNAIVENANDGYRYPGSAYKSLEELMESARLIG